MEMRRLIGGLCLWAGACAPGVDAPNADLIVTRAAIWTGDDARPQAEALAVIGERLVAVGSTASIERWRGPDTVVLDAEGKRVLPGFNDSHVHLVQAGEQLRSVYLKDASSPEELARRLGEVAKSSTAGEWILGGDWDEQRWDPPVLPTRELIDGLTPENPVFVIRYDGHMALANSLALELAGVSRESPDPPAGSVVRSADGDPTGVLKIAAMPWRRS